MKTKHLLLMLLSIAMLTACSEDEDVIPTFQEKYTRTAPSFTSMGKRIEQIKTILSEYNLEDKLVFYTCIPDIDLDSDDIDLIKRYAETISTQHTTKSTWIDDIIKHTNNGGFWIGSRMSDPALYQFDCSALWHCDPNLPSIILDFSTSITSQGPESYLNMILPTWSSSYEQISWNEYGSMIGNGYNAGYVSINGEIHLSSYVGFSYVDCQITYTP